MIKKLFSVPSIPGWLALVVALAGTAYAAIPVFEGKMIAFSVGAPATVPLTISGDGSQSQNLMNVDVGVNPVFGIGPGGELSEVNINPAQLALSVKYAPSQGVAPVRFLNSSNSVMFQEDATGNLTTAGNITATGLSASQAGTIVCRNTVGLLQPCSFPVSTASVTLGSNCLDGTFCGKASIGTFAALGSSGCDVQYFYTGAFNYGIQAYPIYDSVNSKVWAGFVNHTGGTILSGTVLSATYACPYFGN